MKLISAGLLMYRQKGKEIEYLLVHNGLPFYKNKDRGGWTIPKGMVNEGENFLEAAKREFKEETGFDPHEPFVELGSVEQKNNKTVHAWAFAGDFDHTKIKSNMSVTEWPPKSGKYHSFPEIDRGDFFTAEQAREKLGNAQIPFIDRLEKYLNNE